MNSKYDIFISYRREGGAQYARILQLMLQQRGYKVFLDYDELTDGVFKEHIKAAIKNAPIFMLVLSEDSMSRCLNGDDWVRQEILLAMEEKKHIIPVNPDKSFDGFPSDTNTQFIPIQMKDYITSNQYSEIGFGQTLGVTIDLMIEKRLEPTLGRRKSSENVDNDFQSANERLKKKDARLRILRKLVITSVIILLIGLFLGLTYALKTHSRDVKLEKIRTELHSKHAGFKLYLTPGLSEIQMKTIDAVLQNMREIKTDSLWISKFEFSVGQWHGILNESYDESLSTYPKTNVSFGEIYMFLLELSDMTNINFALPSVEEWCFAAHGGDYNEKSLYAGSDVADEVAWYEANSVGVIHPSDGRQGKRPNMLDLYDMSGNVGEICNTPMGTDGHYTVCGGNYQSNLSEIQIDSRMSISTDSKNDKVGFRVAVISNN